MKKRKRRKPLLDSDWADKQRMAVLEKVQDRIEQWAEENIGPRDKGFVTVGVPGSFPHRMWVKHGGDKKHPLVLMERNSVGPKKLPEEIYMDYRQMPQGSVFILTVGGDDQGATESIYTPAERVGNSDMN